MCLNCGKEFETIPSVDAKFCSKICSVSGKFNPNYGNHPKAWNKGLKGVNGACGAPKGTIPWNKGELIERNCLICGNKFNVRISEIKHRYCSQKCVHISKIGNQHSLESTQNRLKNRLKNKPMSKKEREFLSLLNTLRLDYEFVGDGKIIIDRFNPDFKHKYSNKFIELHSYSTNKINAKKEAYENEGYKCLFVCNTLSNFSSATIKKIINFTKG